MASGQLGAADLTALTNTTLYTAPAGVTSTVNVNLCNRTAAPVTARIALSTTATPTLGEYIEYDVSIPANSAIERTAIVVGGGQNIVVYAGAAGVSAVATGFEG